jgi:hypothetical protein
MANPFTGLFDEATKQYGLEPDWLSTFARIESGYNPRVRTGSYKGLFQLSDGEFGKHGGQGDIYDPRSNTFAAAAKLRRERDAFEAKYGRRPTAADIYLIHQQGEGGAAAHWSNPNLPAWQNMYSTAEGRQKGPGWAKQAIWGNVPNDVKAKYGSVDNLTSRDFVDLWTQKVARFGGGAPGPGLLPQPPDGMDAATYGATSPPPSPRMALGGPKPMPQDPNTGEWVPEQEIARRRGLANQMWDVPTSGGGWAGALASLLSGGAHGYENAQMRRAIGGNEQFSNAAMQRALGANGIPGVIDALAGGSPEQKKSALSLMLQEKDPARALDMRAKQRALAQGELTDPLTVEKMQGEIAAAKAKRERDEAFMRSLQEATGQSPQGGAPVPPQSSLAPVPPVGQTPVPGITVTPSIQRSSGAGEGVMPGGVTPAQFAPQAQPQQSQQRPAAPDQDVVNTPWGRMPREKARKLGGEAIMTGEPRYLEMGKVLLEAAGQANAGLGKEARNEVDKKELNTGEYIARLNSIKTKFDPSFQQIENRLGLKWAEWMDSFKAGQKAVSPEQRQSLAKFSQYRQEALANMNQYIKEITGAAMTDAEAKRIIAALPNPGQGLFDGDSPTVFKAKLDNALKSSQLAVVRYRYLRSNGFSGPIDQSNFSLDNMQAVIEKRGSEIEKGIRQQMPKIDPQSLQGEIAARLRQEFGLDI